MGLIADTHGLLRPEALEGLRGVDRILHAGDVGGLDVLEGLRELAPVEAVWGNTDRGTLRQGLPERTEGDLGGILYALIHGHQYGPTTAALVSRFPQARLIVYGHTHVPARERWGHALVVNPGSAGPRRPGRPVTIARLRIRDGDIEEVEHLHLEP